MVKARVAITQKIGHKFDSRHLQASLLSPLAALEKGAVKSSLKQDSLEDLSKWLISPPPPSRSNSLTHWLIHTYQYQPYNPTSLTIVQIRGLPLGSPAFLTLLCMFHWFSVSGQDKISGYGERFHPWDCYPMLRMTFGVKHTCCRLYHNSSHSFSFSELQTWTAWSATDSLPPQSLNSYWKTCLGQDEPLTVLPLKDLEKEGCSIG